MRHGYLQACTATILACCITSFSANAEVNPFVPMTEGQLSREIENRVRSLENQSALVDTRIEEILATQLPAIKASLLETGSTQAQDGIEIIGRVNDSCIGRKAVQGRVTLIQLGPDFSCPGI